MIFRVHEVGVGHKRKKRMKLKTLGKMDIFSRATQYFRELSGIKFWRKAF